MRKTFRRLVLFLFTLLLILSIFLGTFGNLDHPSYVAELLIAAVLLLSVCCVYRHRAFPSVFTDEKSVMYAEVILTILCLILHVAFALLFRPVQAADYQTFWQAAVDLSAGKQPQAKDYLAMFPHILGYSTFLSLFLRVFGPHILVAAVVNAGLTCVSGLLIFLLVREWADGRAAVLASALWCVCPSKLLYVPMVMSEPYYTCLLLLFFLLLTETEKHEDTWNTGRFALAGAAGGLLAGLVNTARPIGLVPVIALVLWLLFLREGTDRRRNWGTLTAALLLVYVLTGALWNHWMTDRLGQKPPVLPGYNIYVGWNTDTGGSYADEDMTWFQGRYFGEFDRNAQEAQNAMLESAKERIRDARGQTASLMLRKLRTLLGNDEGGAFYSRESLSDRAYSLLCVVSNIWYYAVCILAVTGCAVLWRKNEGGSIIAFLLCGLGIILAQLLVEVASRYHYSLIPLFITLAVCRSGTRTKLQTE